MTRDNNLIVLYNAYDGTVRMRVQWETKAEGQEAKGKEG